MNRLDTPFAAQAARPHVDAGTSPAMAERLMAEGLKSLVEIAASLPPVNGKRVSTSSILRWVLRGKSGVKLEAIRLHGGSWFSSMPAVARFASALTNARH
jgi:hypothetical protein